VSEELLKTHGLRAGGRLRLWGTTGLTDLTVSVLPLTDARKVGGGIVVVSLPTAQYLFGLGEKVNLVRLVLEDNADLQVTRAAVVAKLPPGLFVREPAARADITQGLRAAASSGLTGLTAVALAATGYIVFGMAQLNLLARRPEFAILRTLGASARQVEGILLQHALILGASGGTAGMVCGVLLARAILKGFGAAAGPALAHPHLSWATLALGPALGVGISLCAVLFPARSVCRTPPLALFRADTDRRSSESRRWPTFVAMFCLALGAGILTGCAERQFALVTGRFLFPPALVLALVGLAGVVAPRLVTLLALLETPIRFLFGVGGCLAVRQLIQRPDRTVRACGVGFISMTVVVGFGHSVLNTLADVQAWAERAIPADLLIHGAPPDPGFVLNAPLPESLGDELRVLDGVAGVDRIAFIPAAVNGTPTLVLARTFAPDQPLPLALRKNEADLLRAALASGEVVLAESLANTLRVSTGDWISLDTPTGPRRVRVAGIVIEFAAGGAALYLDWDAATALFGPLGTHVFLVTANPERKSGAEASVTRFCASRGLFLQRNPELQKAVKDLTRGLTAGLWALLSVMVVVAALGMANTVAALAIEQREDTRCLRAVGMSAKRVRRMFRLQAALLAFTSLPVGLPCGIILALALDHAISGLWGYGIPFQIQWRFLLGAATTSIVAGFLAGILSGSVNTSR
jgi:putative ABC transport system permease protein